MKQYLLALTIFLFTILSFSQTTPEKINESEFSIGKMVEIKSEVLNENRVLNIYLPSSYSSETEKTYPVIYLLDGSADEDFIHVSGLVQFASFSWINMIPESIVVGIGNVDRHRDFTFPSQNKEQIKEVPTSGGSEKFIEFLKTELQPFINASFRTSAEKTLIGQSLGGLLATEILFKKPELFDHYIIVSPSLWWDDESLLKNEPVKYSSEKNIYIAVGKEGEMMERPARELYEMLKQMNPENNKIHFEFLDDKNHGDALHITVYHAFETLFKTEE